MSVFSKYKDRPVESYLQDQFAPFTDTDIIDELTGAASARGDAEKQKDAVDKAVGVAEGLKANPLSGVDLENYQYQGDLSPELIAGAGNVNFTPTQLREAQATMMGPTAMGDVSVDPRLREQQMASLGALQDLASHGGMNAADRANLNRVQSEAAQADRGRREAILMNQRARGMGGSGNELLAQLASSQAATDRQSQQGLDIAGMAQQRALDAMLRSGGMAGDMRNQDWNEQARVAEAKDRIAQFNANVANTNSQFNAGQGNDMARHNSDSALKTAMYNTDNTLGTQKFNAGATYDANKSSWDARQGIANKNTDVNNTETMHNKFTVPKTNTDNEMNVAQTQIGAYGLPIKYYGDQADAKRKDRQQLVGGALQAGTTIGGAAMGSDRRIKKDVKEIQPADLDEFLAALKPATFVYKDPEAEGDGRRAGVMAQDLLKSPLGADTVVIRDDNTFGVDNGKLQGVLIAAIKHLSEKIDGKKKG